MFVFTGVVVKATIQKDSTGMTRNMRTSALCTGCCISQMVGDRWREESLILCIFSDI